MKVVGDITIGPHGARIRVMSDLHVTSGTTLTLGENANVQGSIILDPDAALRVEGRREIEIKESQDE